MNYVVLWNTQDKSGKRYEMTVNQQMDLVRYGDTLKITRLRATTADSE